MKEKETCTNCFRIRKVICVDTDNGKVMAHLPDSNWVELSESIGDCRLRKLDEKNPQDADYRRWRMKDGEEGES